MNKAFGIIFKRHSHSWVKPVGYDTNIQIYNCIAKKKVPFIIKNKDYLNWYTCGPTVYDSSHIGHASCYVKLDIIQRILKDHFGLNLVTVMNITDIDDKIIARSNQLKISASDLSRMYLKEFLDDLNTLNIRMPDIVVRVTDKIDLIIKFIQTLLKNGFAYKSKDGSVYFDTSKLDDYGKLQNISLISNDLERNEFKKSNMDFALWKGVKPNEPYWDSDWGSGRPGWHIECSAIAGFILGNEIDVHAGGIDLQFPHHENEEAQSCAYFSKKQWVNYWIHTGHLHSGQNEKMSKSLKNVISIPEMLKSCTPEDFRMACLMSHYSKSMHFSPELMKSARNLSTYYKNFFSTCSSYANDVLKVNVNRDVLKTNLSKITSEIDNCLRDDFDTASMLKSLHNFTSTVNKMLSSSATTLVDDHLLNKTEVVASANYVLNILQKLGINFFSKSKVSDQQNSSDDLLNILLDFRQNVRNTALLEKNTEYLKFCDELRTTLAQLGITVKDYNKKTTTQ